MNKTEYVILDDECKALTLMPDFHKVRELTESFAKENPGKRFYIATITHSIKSVIKTEWDE